MRISLFSLKEIKKRKIFPKELSINRFLLFQGRSPWNCQHLKAMVRLGRCAHCQQGSSSHGPAPSLPSPSLASPISSTHRDPWPVSALSLVEPGREGKKILMTKRGPKAWLGELDGLESLRHQVDPAFPNPAGEQDGRPQRWGFQANAKAAGRRGAGRTKGGGRQVQLQGQQASPTGARSKTHGPGVLGARPACARLSCRGGGLAARTSRRFPGKKAGWGLRGPGMLGPPRLDTSAAEEAQPWGGFQLSQEICFSRAAPKRKLMSFLPNFAFTFYNILKCINWNIHISRLILSFRKRTQILKSQYSGVLLTF